MDKLRFQELLEKICKPTGPRRTYESPVFTIEDYASMTTDQLCKVIFEMMKFAGPGSYWLRQDLLDLIDHLDRVATIPEDPNLEKYLHMTASLVCLTRYQGYNFREVLPEGIARHLMRIIGPPPFKINEWLIETEPSVQIATFIAYPLLEGVSRRKLSQYISLKGKVIKEFTLDVKREKGSEQESKIGYQEKILCKNKVFKKGERINRLDDELRLLKQTTNNPSLREVLTLLDEDGLFDEVQDWRWQLLHGVLSASWHGIKLLLLTYLILLMS